VAASSAPPPRRRAATCSESAAILFTVLLAFTEIRHAVNGGDIYRVNTSLAEFALQVCVALAMAIGLERLRIRTGSIVHNVGAVLLTLYAGLPRCSSDAAGDADIVATNVGGVFITCSCWVMRYGRAGVAAVLCGRGPAPPRLRQHDRGGRARSRADLCDV